LATFLEQEVQEQLSTAADSEHDEFVLPDEEYDQELFGIFMQQLQEKVTLLEEYFAELPKASNQHELLTLTHRSFRKS
jgi:hypothetical protein